MEETLQAEEEERQLVFQFLVTISEEFIRIGKEMQLRIKDDADDFEHVSRVLQDWKD